MNDEDIFPLYLMGRAFPLESPRPLPLTRPFARLRTSHLLSANRIWRAGFPVTKRQATHGEQRRDMCSTCEYARSMAKMIQLRHVPDALHRQLKARAAMAGLSLSDFLVREVRKIAEQPTPEEMAERLKQREPYRGKLSPTQVLRAERDSG